MRNARVVTRGRVVPRGYVAVEDGLIVDLGEEPYRRREGFDEVHLNGMVVGPGFVDTHIHGALGVDLSTSTVSDIVRLSRELPKFGVTSYTPTSVTLPQEELVRFCRNVRAASSAGEGARVLGIHLEGPYINPRRAGAQNPNYARQARLSELAEVSEASGGNLKSITVAPEVSGVRELIKYATSSGLVVQIGHTDAGYATTREALSLGASKATHLYNAMSGIHHRTPGAALALLYSKNTYLELIVDFIHVAPEVVSFTIDYAGYRRVVLVSDSISATGLPDGTYKLGGLDVEVSGGVARLVGRDVLAGSTLTMDRAFRNALSLGLKLEEAFYMASTTPAESIGLDSKIGSVDLGRAADLVVLGEGLSVVATFVGGKLAYAERDFVKTVLK
ncbi:MAG: N-acetylglucosamine-6-phosphate deacetylase [Sulfolobales archaeon]|nr:N-acetylglucosamine-6-phosphate deacetylase [Sulfolobales archaeon]MCX8209322.1 N-acetylglucosamine-6-phosphate deacetylase [Sulfolobales archaeon]MDW8010134.1 N-acetylglucosamine-6-phosphate deacetylase [Sulfolobales archaeon]